MVLKKKLAVLGLAALMTAAFIPAMAFADVGSTAANPIQITSDTSQLGNGTYRLTDNLTQSLTIQNGVTATIDLNSYTLTNMEGQDTITVEKGGKLTITDSSSTKGTIDNISDRKAAIINNGNVSIENGVKIRRSKESGKDSVDRGGNSNSNIVNHGTMTIDHADVEQSGGYSDLIENGYFSEKAYSSETGDATPTLTINGGNFSGGSDTVRNGTRGVLYVNGGTFSNTQCVLSNVNVARIKDGTFNLSGTNENDGIIYNSASFSDGNIDKNSIGNLTVDGGVYSGNNLFCCDADLSADRVSVHRGDFEGIVKGISYLDSTQKFISGGTFGINPSVNVADNIPVAVVTNGPVTIYVVGENFIKEAAQDPDNTVEITKGSITLNGANATIKNAKDNTGTVKVDGETLKQGSSKQAGDAQTIANLKNQIASLQSQLAQAQASASKDSSASSSQIAQLKKDLADAQAQLKSAQDQLKAAQDQSASQNSTLTAPGQVMNLKVKAGKRKAKLTWTALTNNTTGYRVYRKVKGGKYAKVKTIKTAATATWTNKGLKKGKTYYYKVRAYKSITSGELWGAYSNTAKGKIK